MGRNFYYGSDARIVAGSAHFSAAINVDPLSLGIPVERAEEYQAADALLQNAYRRANTPATRTTIAVREKNDALRIVQRQATDLAQTAYATESVSNSQLIALGLQPRAKRTRREVPQTPPTVRVVSVRGRVVKISIDARATEGSRLAFGATGAQVYTFVGDEPPADPREYDHWGFAPRATAEIVFPDDVPSGATAWVSAAWVSKRGKQGTASVPTRVTITGGPALPASAA